MKYFPFIIVFAVLASNAYAVSVTKCGDSLSVMGATYDLQNDIISDFNQSSGSFNYCLGLSNGNITFDCHGYSIISSVPHTQIGLFSTWGDIDHFTMKNCNVDLNNSGTRMIFRVTGGDNAEQPQWNIYDNIFTTNGLLYFYFYPGTGGSHVVPVTDMRIYNNYFLGRGNITMFYLQSGAGYYDNISLYTNFFNQTVTILGNPSAGAATNWSVYNNYFTDNPSFNNFNYTTLQDALNTSSRTGPNIVGGPFIGGNYWGDFGTGYSEICDDDAPVDGFCDTTPYNPSTDRYDYLPLAGTYTTVSVTNTTATFNITIYNANGALLTGPTFTVTTDGPNFTFTNTTSSARLVLTGMPGGNYSIRVSNANYSTATFEFTAEVNTIYNINAYMLNNTDTVTLTVVDNDDNSYISDATVKMYRDIISALTLVESKKTDITGNVQFSYMQNTRYQFNVSKSGYITQVFDINPITRNSYTVRLRKGLPAGSGPDYAGVTVYYAPKSYATNDTGTFNMTFYSPDGGLLSYGYNISYGSIISNQSGTSSTGATLQSAYNLTNIGGRFNITYWYNSTYSGYRSFRVSYLIKAYPALSWEQLKDQTFGLGIFERLFVAVLITIIVAGVTTLIAGAGTGGAFGLFLLGFFVFVGFVPIWAGLITFFVGTFLVLRRTD